MTFLSAVVRSCARHALIVFMAGLIFAAGAAGLTVTHLGMTTDLDGLFSSH
jgi:hypothetical protein